MISFFFMSLIISLLFVYTLAKVAKNIKKPKLILIGVFVFLIFSGLFLSLYIYYGTRVPEGTTPFTPEEVANPISLNK
ncbi:hypothetical protein [Acinetobacter sp. 3657]|uniref:hypothetical protein n=1 Tax=Acinetobacter sp. 3657 TaxID=2817764 RepID=UPI0028657412|nr:hypothetical protein [Prolinoborus sp. 3657]